MLLSAFETAVPVTILSSVVVFSSALTVIYWLPLPVILVTKFEPSFILSQLLPSRVNVHEPTALILTCNSPPSEIKVVPEFSFAEGLTPSSAFGTIVTISSDGGTYGDICLIFG